MDRRLKAFEAVLGERRRPGWGESQGLPGKGRSRSGALRATYTVEALVLLACVLVVLAVAMALLSRAQGVSLQAQQEQQAMTLAQNAAERFLADPASVPPVQVQGDYQVLCQSSQSPTAAGSLYEGRMTVTLDGQEVYSLDLSCYRPQDPEVQP